MCDVCQARDGTRWEHPWQVCHWFGEVSAWRQTAPPVDYRGQHWPGSTIWLITASILHYLSFHFFQLTVCAVDFSVQLCVFCKGTDLIIKPASAHIFLLSWFRIILPQKNVVSAATCLFTCAITYLGFMKLLDKLDNYWRDQLKWFRHIYTLVIIKKI